MHALLSVFTFLVGLACGSFLNVCIVRLPLGESVVSPSSRCRSCHQPIGWSDNIPLIGWFKLRGRCSRCHAPFSLRYPLVEITTAVLFLACYWHFRDLWPTLKYATLCWLLLGLFFTDLEHRLLPDALTLGGIVAGVAFSFFTWVAPPEAITGTPRTLWQLRVISVEGAIAGALMGASLLYLIGEAYRLARGREGMGFGDVKLAGMIGAFLGIKLVFLSIFWSAILASFAGIALLVTIYLRRRRRYKDHRRAVTSLKRAMTLLPLPYGSYLAATAILAAFYGQRAVDWYWNQF